ncbi:nucleotidyltransferase domain-containing protein [Candidatus Pacearchaeota archaeon]|jgi:predicted nucleotidyltransferase|nr:nucleotidyltransferase domain-containing protein [Candidatus Pacearchaeota archaeon]
MNLIQNLKSQKLIQPPEFLADNIQYLVHMGSFAYGASTESSDIDIYGWCIPPKEDIFPHLRGEIFGFGRQKKRFEQWQQHHIKTQDGNKEYDFSVYSIIKYFQLVMENNPNMIDSLFVPQRCILHCTQVGDLVRENRKLFLHKGVWPKFKGYSFSQKSKMINKNPEGERKKIIDEFGYDVKFALHLVRLLNEVEQIMIEGDLDIERNAEQLKSIRRGEWTLEQVIEYFNTKERNLETLYTSSTLRWGPDEKVIKELLLKCLEHHYGSLDKCIVKETTVAEVIDAIQETINRFR